MRRKSSLAAVSAVLMLAVLGLSPDAAAAGARPDGPLAAHIAGSVLRAQIWHDNLNEQHLWRFKADGTVQSDYWLVENGARASDGFSEDNDTGRWRVEDGKLCIRWRLMFEAERQCYRLTPLRPGWVRFSNVGGGPSFDAQMSR